MGAGRGRAKLGAIVGAIASGILCAVAGVLPRGWYPLAALLICGGIGIVGGAIGGSIAGLIAGADRTGAARRPATWRRWLLAASPILVLFAWKSGLFSPKATTPPFAPIATPPAAPPAPAFRPTTWWDVVKGDATAAIAPVVKAIQDRFVFALPVLILVGFPIFAMAYGAFLGGWAVRYVKEQDIATRRQLGRGFEEFTSFEKK